MPSGCEPVRSTSGSGGPALPPSPIGTRTTARPRDSTTSSASPVADRQQPFGNRGVELVQISRRAARRDPVDQPVVVPPLARVRHVQVPHAVERGEVRDPHRVLGRPVRVRRDISRRRDPHDRRVPEVAREHVARAADRDAVDEAAGRRDLLEGTGAVDPVDLARLAAGVEQAVGTDGDALGMVQAGRDALEGLEPLDAGHAHTASASCDRSSGTSDARAPSPAISIVTTLAPSLHMPRNSRVSLWQHGLG